MIDRLNEALAGRFAIDREIGRGGMATVFLAQDKKLGRSVAIKVLSPDIAASIGSERFLREIEIAAKLTHPNILPLHDCGEAGELLYYVMPYVAGGSLRQRIRSERQLPLQVVLGILGPVAAALGHAHRHGVIHRDVKPENILFSEDQPVVADFGIAKAISSAGTGGLTHSGFPVGTVGYMSPEQAGGRAEIDGRTDVCSLASVAYEMLVGETPGVWPVPDEVSLGRFQEIPSNHRQRLDRLPGRVEQVLVKGLSMRMSERFGTPVEFTDALSAASQPSGKLSDSEVRDIISLAAERQVTTPTDEPALSLAGVEQVAAQVGIPPDQVRNAALEVARSSTAAPVARPSQSTTQFSKGRLTLDRTIPGEVSGRTLELMVNEINRQLGFVGSVSTVGNSLHWSGTKPGFVGRDVRISLTTASGQTSLHIEEHIELRGPSIFVPAWGAAGGGLVGFGLGAMLGLGEGAAMVAVLLPCVFGGAFLTATGVPKGIANKNRVGLEELADRLEEIGQQEGGQGR